MEGSADGSDTENGSEGEGAAGGGGGADEDISGDHGATTSTRTRFWLTNDGAAWWLLGTFPVWVAFDGVGWIDLSAVPAVVLRAWVLVVGVAAAWTFGAEAIRAWRGDG